MNLIKIGANETELNILKGEKGYKILFSYNTPVAYITSEGGFRSLTVFSKTTTKHTNAFLLRHGCELASVVTQDSINKLVA